MTTVFIVVGHWSYQDDHGWTIEAVCSTKDKATAYIAALPREAYTRGDASWRYQAEEHAVDPTEPWTSNR